MSNEDRLPADLPMSVAASEALLVGIASPRDPIQDLAALRHLLMGKADHLECGAWSLTSRRNVARQLVLSNLNWISGKIKAEVVRKIAVMTAREIPRAAVVAMIDEVFMDLGQASRLAQGAAAPTET